MSDKRNQWLAYGAALHRLHNHGLHANMAYYGNQQPVPWYQLSQKDRDYWAGLAECADPDFLPMIASTMVVMAHEKKRGRHLAKR